MTFKYYLAWRGLYEILVWVKENVRKPVTGHPRVWDAWRVPDRGSVPFDRGCRIPETAAGGIRDGRI